MYPLCFKQSINFICFKGLTPFTHLKDYTTDGGSSFPSSRQAESFTCSFTFQNFISERFIVIQANNKKMQSIYQQCILKLSKPVAINFKLNSCSL